ncbi:MAG: class I SAM-dependent methyltransferase [Limnochordaceae bacterium]|nr:class I SAM-dependent methyltransferase [Limnochordaceae bacterium]
MRPGGPGEGGRWGRIVMTTARQPTPVDEQEVEQLAAELGIGFCARRGRATADLLDDPGAVPPGYVLVVAGRDRQSRQWTFSAYEPGSKAPFMFHPNMAKVRVQTLRLGGRDPMVEAMGLTIGQTVLDCTLGLAADAIVASFVTGPTGRVVGWESSAAIALVVRWGLAHYTLPPRSELPPLVDAMRRIRVEWRDHREGLPLLPDNSFDVVYFDPMFRQPIRAAQPLAPLRSLADPRPLTLESIDQARRVARRRVVVKERADGTELTRLQLPERVQGKDSLVAFGVWRKQ